jgi:hypothetical protein
MERAAAESSIDGRKFIRGDLVYAVAGREDEGDVRRLLADNATDGWIRLSLEREPDAFAAAAIMGQYHGTIIARDRRSSAPVGMCEWSARGSYIDGEVRLLAYLGALRVAPPFRHRLGVIKGGFEAVRRLLHRQPATPYALTAIAAENTAALRLLGANLPGMPSYRVLEAFSTFALRPRHAGSSPVRVERAAKDDVPAIAVRLARSYREYQFAPAWSARDLTDPVRCNGLQAEDFLVVRRGPGIAGCIALWDQGAFKQTVVRGYAGRLGIVRPLANLAGPMIGLPRLPAVGEPLRQVYLSHVAVEDNDPGLFRALIDAGLAQARHAGFPLALVGLVSRHPLAAVLKHHYRPREYRTLLHLVHWDDGHAAADAVGSRMPHVEIALL